MYPNYDFSEEPTLVDTILTAIIYSASIVITIGVLWVLVIFFLSFGV